jgi:tight adherence protein C
MSTILVYTLAVLAFFTVFVGCLAAVDWLDNRRRAEVVRSKIIRGAGGASPMPSDGLLQVLTRTLAGLFQRVGVRMQPKDEAASSATKTALIRAGLRHPGAPVAYWGAKAALAMLMGGGFLLVKFLFLPHLPVGHTLVPAAGMALAGLYIPRLWLWSRTSTRRTAFEHGLPDTLDLLVVSVESGMGLDQALHRVGEEMRLDCPVISDEFKILNLESRAGKSRGDCLRDLAARVGLEDLSSLVTLLVQSEAFGTSVTQTLRIYSDVLRTKRHQRAEEKAAKLPVKLLFPLVLFIFPALFVVIAGPAVISLMDVFPAK